MDRNKLPPEGTYRGHIAEVTLDTDQYGNPCLNVDTVFGYGDSFDGSGDTEWHADGRLYLDGARPDTKGRTALSRTMEALRCAGFEWKDPTLAPGSNFPHEVSLAITHRSFVGRDGDTVWVLKCAFINPPRRTKEPKAPPSAATLAAWREKNGFTPVGLSPEKSATFRANVVAAVKIDARKNRRKNESPASPPAEWDGIIDDSGDGPPR